MWAGPRDSCRLGLGHCALDIVLLIGDHGDRCGVFATDRLHIGLEVGEWSLEFVGIVFVHCRGVDEGRLCPYEIVFFEASREDLTEILLVVGEGGEHCILKLCSEAGCMLEPSGGLRVVDLHAVVGSLIDTAAIAATRAGEHRKACRHDKDALGDLRVAKWVGRVDAGTFFLDVRTLVGLARRELGGQLVDVTLHGDDDVPNHPTGKDDRFERRTVVGALGDVDLDRFAIGVGEVCCAGAVDGQDALASGDDECSTEEGVVNNVGSASFDWSGGIDKFCRRLGCFRLLGSSRRDELRCRGEVGLL